MTGLNGIEMTGIIEIEGMEFFAYHGCFEAEQIVGNKFMVYACLHYNCHCPASTDDIADALSYQTAYEIIAREMMKRSHLLEHVCSMPYMRLSLNCSMLKSRFRK